MKTRKWKSYEKMFNEMKAELSGMMAGFEGNYQEKDPAAQSKLQYIQQLIESNPKAQGQMNEDEQFKALLENYVQSLQFQIQQQQNSMVGKIGVKPMQQ